MCKPKGQENTNIYERISSICQNVQICNSFYYSFLNNRKNGDILVLAWVKKEEEQQHWVTKPRFKPWNKLQLCHLSNHKRNNWQGHSTLDGLNEGASTLLRTILKLYYRFKNMFKLCKPVCTELLRFLSDFLDKLKYHTSSTQTSSVNIQN